MVKSDISALIGYLGIHEPVPIPSEISDFPTNYLRVSRSNGGGIREVPISVQYLIDFSLPPVPLPHAVSGTENLFLHTTCGPVTADVWVTGNNKSRQASMKLFTDYGKVSAKIHNAFSGGRGAGRPSLNIEVQANGGEVSLSLPRCFRGQITIKCNQQRIVLSPALQKCTTLLSDVKDVCVYFIGDQQCSRAEDTEDAEDTEHVVPGAFLGAYPEVPPLAEVPEPLDELLVHGKSMGGNSDVRICYDGEPVPK